ncbi:MAG: TadE/TadG family type IV pilus assembly protein [Blastocatellales bacterium]
MRKTIDEKIQNPGVRRVLFPGRIAANRGERGAQLAELAIVLPIMLVFLGATAEFGLYYNSFITLSKATRIGARYLSAKNFTPTEQLKTKRLVVCGELRSTACTAGTEVISGLTDDNVVIDYIPADPNTEIPDRITVRIVDYNYQPVFDLGRFIGGASWAAMPVTPSTTLAFAVEN